jgi:hypothetical protein
MKQRTEVEAFCSPFFIEFSLLLAGGEDCERGKLMILREILIRKEEK